mmetsp:Transcript_11343/g.21846  ORF Transcript_11343/g.21846 Transcript_11343/m.21846 type:complete len:111 (+) Transcript_11343:981-1313(+)
MSHSFSHTQRVTTEQRESNKMYTATQHATSGPGGHEKKRRKKACLPAACMGVPPKPFSSFLGGNILATQVQKVSSKRKVFCLCFKDLLLSLVSLFAPSFPSLPPIKKPTS